MSRKSLFFVCAAAALLPFCQSSLAADVQPVDEPVSGFFGDAAIYASHSWLSGNELGGSEDDKYLSLGGQARLGSNFGDAYLWQADVFGEVTDSNGDDPFESGVGLAGHLAWRDPAVGLLGIFGGGVITDQDDDSSDSSERGFIGLEGQYFIDATTLYGQVGWLGGKGGNDDSGEDSIYNAMFARGVLRYFLSEATKLEGELSGAFGSMDNDNDDVTVIGWGLKAEHQFGSNWSGWLGYQGNRYDQDNEDDIINEHIASLGLRFNFGGTSLLAQDRDGASLDTPSFVRWVGQTGGPLE